MNSQVSELVSSLISYSIQMKTYHWQTHNLARHKAADSVVETLQDFIDEIVECTQNAMPFVPAAAGAIPGSVPDRIVFEDFNIPMRNFLSEESGLSLLQDIAIYVQNVEFQNVALVNKQQEVLAKLQKALYFFSLQ